MFIIQYDINFAEEKFICIHGQLVSDGEPILVGSYTYIFQKVYEGTQLTTPRQFLEQFDTYQEMVTWVQNNHPEQVENIPSEEFM